MATQLRWTDDLDRVADTRALCYGSGRSGIDRFKQGIRDDQRAQPGDFLLAETNGRPVGTTTSMSLTMWVRGSPLPCQGVAYVGTIKTHRRRNSSKEEPGIATLLMRETIRIARERGQVLSALMPFRASFYEHFGYGIVEQRNEWTIPLSLLPTGASEGIEILDEQNDLPALKSLRQASVEQGQCDIERTEASWRLRGVPTTQWQSAGNGLEVIDRPDPIGPARGYAYFVEEREAGKTLLRVPEWHADSPASFRRLLHFFASLKDQYSTLRIQLPADIQLNWLLKESQIPHRPVEHAVAEVRPFTRMQVRILDHKQLLESLKIPVALTGNVCVEVAECEGESSRFQVQFEGGRTSVKASTAPANFTCPDHVWAAVALGHIRATDAVRWGLAVGFEQAALILNGLAEGRPPFCTEYF